MASEAKTDNTDDTKSDSNIEIFFEAKVGSGLVAPVVKASSDGVPYVYVAASQTGQIWRRSLVEELDTKPDDGTPCYSIDGQPSGLAWDSKDDVLYVGDLAYKAILTVSSDGSAVRHVGEYEQKKLKGPHSVAFDKKGNLYFTDSGGLGDTSLCRPRGSVFVIEGGPSGTLLKPLALECLACPSGLAVANDNVVYVCETLRNRVLRFVRSDSGAWVPSVWRQFSGLLGPVGVACKQLKDGGHCVVVARSGAAGADPFSTLSVLDSLGQTMTDINIPSSSCSGVALGPRGQALVTAENKIYQVLF